MLKEFFDKITFKPDPVRIYSAGISDVGRRRKLNEDNYLIDESLGLFIVADGMGGHEAGEVASKLAIETIFNHLKKLISEQSYAAPKETPGAKVTISEAFCSVLQDAIEEANNQTHCYNIAQGLTEGKGMGTTVTGFWIGAADDSWSSEGTASAEISRKKQLYTFNVGDSRTYRFHQGKLQQLSTDHSHYQLWIETGREGPPPKHNIIYKAIGPWRRIAAEQKIYPIIDNELILLCSDGLCDMVSDREIRDILYQNRKNNLKAMAKALVAAANDAGGKDNITVVLVKPA